MGNELYIHDFIGKSMWEVGVTADGVREAMASLDKKQPMTLRINSPGGSVSEAISIVQELRQWDAGIDVVVDGQAASAGSYIAMVGKTIAIAEGGWMMIHNPWTLVGGDSRYLRKQADHLDGIGKDLNRAYERRTGKSPEEIQKMMDEETWLTADQAIEHKFADSKIEFPAMAMVIPEAFGFKHPPKAPEHAKQRPANKLAILQRQLDLARRAC